MLSSEIDCTTFVQDGRPRAHLCTAKDHSYELHGTVFSFRPIVVEAEHHSSLVCLKAHVIRQPRQDGREGWVFQISPYWPSQQAVQSEEVKATVRQLIVSREIMWEMGLRLGTVLWCTLSRASSNAPAPCFVLGSVKTNLYLPLCCSYKRKQHA